MLLTLITFIFISLTRNSEARVTVSMVRVRDMVWDRDRVRVRFSRAIRNGGPESVK